MSKEIFRSIDFWKSAVMKMQDNSFFELLRSVFGKIKTPFKKQQLINDLETFLLREDIQKTIASYIDEDDIKIIAAVAVFAEPAPGELESFFSGELSFAQLQDIIVNLEERFILYRFTEDGISRLALNPVLKQILLPFTGQTASLFEAALFTTAGEEPDNSPAGGTAGLTVLDDRILAGLLSFVLHGGQFFKAAGVIRKRIIDEGKTRFPGIDIALILGGMQVLGLFYSVGDGLTPDMGRFEEFGELSARERMEYCAAAMLVYGEINPVNEEILPPLFKDKVRERVNLIRCFLDSLDEETKYPQKSLIKLAEILKVKTGVAVKSAALLDVLEKTGLYMPPAAKKSPAETNKPVIAIDSGFSVLVYPEIEYTDAVKLASILDIKDAHAVVRFELDKDSAVSAFDRNIRADEIIALLNRLSGGRVDNALAWNLKDWEKRYGDVSLKKGVVLTLSPERLYLTETMPLADMICETLAPGVFLLPENAAEQAAAALNNAGIDIIALTTCVANGQAGRQKTASQKHFPPPCAAEYSFKIPAGERTTVTRASPERAGELTENFRSILEKTQLDEAARTELSARIDRRLVLCEAQIKEAYIRYEKLEARHMDYTGKQNVAKQALAQQSPVEIETAGKKIFGVPKALEKEDGKLVMVIIPDNGQDPASPAEPIRVPLAKMSLLRRIKKSIFT
jgi:hypothetical protein